MKYLAYILTVIIAFAGSGCLLSAEEGSWGTGAEIAGEELGSAESALEESNALSLNALSLNALSLNALSLNALDPSSLASLQNPGPNGNLARQLVRYAASCALEPTQSIQYTWTDTANVTHNETNWGSLGLASTWTTAALTVAEEKRVSACLIARVNWYGVSVVISMRGDASQLSATSAEEKATYSVLEGAFWGNIFTSTPEAFACYYGPNVAASRARQRDCAAGHSDVVQGAQPCGIIDIVGPCEERCDPLDPGLSYYTGCAAAGDTYDGAKITTWLHG